VTQDEDDEQVAVREREGGDDAQARAAVLGAEERRGEGREQVGRGAWDV
jgi:hypothetical protein